MNSFPLETLPCIDKENLLESLTINEVELTITHSHALPHPHPTHFPLSLLSTNLPANNEGTWKRVPMIPIESDTIMEEAVGTKKTTRHTASQYALLKKRKTVSQIDNVYTKILAEAGSQPCQMQ